MQLDKLERTLLKYCSHFFQLDTNTILEQDIIDEETCNSEVEMLKQDIDKLYSIVKNYHETNEVSVMAIPVVEFSREGYKIQFQFSFLI